MSLVLPNLWLGNLDLTRDFEFLRENKISHVITLLESDYSSPELVAQGVTHMRILIHDLEEEPIYDIFERTCAFLDNAMKNGGCVYVHCFMGISRSPTIVAAYLIKHCDMTACEALDHLQHVRPIVCPNDGFRKALERWEQQLQQQLRAKTPLAHTFDKSQ